MSRVAVLIPCFNEGKTIAGVIREFKAQLSDADIYVFDNNSTDNTVNEARNAGAIVRYEKKQGKGNVVRSMFRQIDADIYVMVDGDGTYPADRVHDLIKPIIEDSVDMVIGSRLHSDSESNFKLLNHFGNRMFRFILNSIFRVQITDLLSGYRAFKRDVVKNLPLLGGGFEIETELTIKCLERRYRIIEIPVNLTTRPTGSESKIRIFQDGILIFNTIFGLFRDYKPLTAFGSIGLLLFVLGVAEGFPEVFGYSNFFPPAIIAAGLICSGLIVTLAGLVIHTISRRFQEIDYQLQSISEILRSQKDEVSK